MDYFNQSPSQTVILLGSLPSSPISPSHARFLSLSYLSSYWRRLFSVQANTGGLVFRLNKKAPRYINNNTKSCKEAHIIFILYLITFEKFFRLKMDEIISFLYKAKNTTHDRWIEKYWGFILPFVAFSRSTDPNQVERERMKF